MATPKSKGRSISGPENVRREPPLLPPAPPSGPVPGPGSPFASFAPDSGTLAESAEENRRQSMGVLAIVAGMVFAMVAAVVVGGVVILLWLAYRQSRLGDDVAAVDPKDDQHVRDTGSAGPIAKPIEQPGSGPRRGKGGAGGGDPSGHTPPSGPPPGPATLIVPASMMFITVEINCPGGFRNRGNFRADGSNLRATVQGVPGDERCTVTFQGSEPAKTWITGNETKTCTFNPVTCHIVR